MSDVKNKTITLGALLLINASLANANCRGEYVSNATQSSGVAQCANASFTAPGADKHGVAISLYCAQTGYSLALQYPTSFGSIPFGTPFTLAVDNNEPVSGDVGLGNIGSIVLHDTSSYSDSQNDSFWTLIKQIKQGRRITASVNNIVSAVIPLAGFSKSHEGYCKSHFDYRKTL